MLTWLLHWEKTLQRCWVAEEEEGTAEEAARFWFSPFGFIQLSSTFCRSSCSWGGRAEWLLRGWPAPRGFVVFWNVQFQKQQSWVFLLLLLLFFFQSSHGWKELAKIYKICLISQASPCLTFRRQFLLRWAILIHICTIQQAPGLPHVYFLLEIQHYNISLIIHLFSLNCCTKICSQFHFDLPTPLIT